MENSLSKPTVIIIGGPNGAGKSTLARTLLTPDLEFVNADEIAKSLKAGSEENVGNVDVAAGKLALQRMDQLASEKRSFAVETTLSSRKLATRIQRLQADGYEFKLYYVWVKSPDLSINRVADRVRMGGHNILEDVIRRRYERGLHNFLQIYRELAGNWFLIDNSEFGTFALIVEGNRSDNCLVHDVGVWNKILQIQEGNSPMENPDNLPTHVAEGTAKKTYLKPAMSEEAKELVRLGRLAVRQAMIEHKAAGMPMVVWRDDKIVWIPADELIIEDE